MQEVIIKQKPALKSAMIPLPTIHLTVMVMHLDGEEDIQK